ncbi:MAG: hypothetical protein HFF00_01435 [Ruminiclostridium sp.]|jgi:hypothetical protein|nr:hypothetical protein [Ruminiclostridium sp.]
MKQVRNLFVLILVLGILGACSVQPQQELSAAVLEEFGLSSVASSEMDWSPQTIHQVHTEDGVSLEVVKTLGNGNELYVLYQLTFPETWEIGILESDGLPKLYFDVICVSSSEYNKETTKSLLVRSHLEPYAKQRWLHYDSNARTLSCVSEYNFEESYRGQKLFFLMGNLYVSGPNRDEYLPWDNSMAVSWIAEN